MILFHGFFKSPCSRSPVLQTLGRPKPPSLWPRRFQAGSHGCLEGRTLTWESEDWGGVLAPLLMQPLEPGLTSISQGFKMYLLSSCAKQFHVIVLTFSLFPFFLFLCLFNFSIRLVNILCILFALFKKSDFLIHLLFLFLCHQINYCFYLFLLSASFTVAFLSFQVGF